MSVEQIHEELNRLVTDLGDVVQCPPECFTFMRGTYVAYESRETLTVSFPVLTEYRNPVRAMQGGFIAAAIDNTMGPLSYLATRNSCSTLDLHVQYLRSVLAGDVLNVTARVTSRGRQTLTLEAEAHDGRGKLIAKASSTMLILR